MGGVQCNHHGKQYVNFQIQFFVSFFVSGYHSQLDSPDAIRTGALQSYYYAPKTQIRATEKYRALNMPLWPREFPVGWRDLNKGIEDEALVER